MKKYVLILTCFVFVAFQGHAQYNYKTGVGLRGGYPFGITVNHFVSKSSAVEGVMSFGWGGFGVTALYKIHNPFPDIDGVKWYYGLGGHLATAKTEKHNPWSSNPGGKLFIGVDGIVGAEYVFADYPFSISLDVLPILNLVEDTYLWFNAGLSVRYTFK